MASKRAPATGYFMEIDSTAELIAYAFIDGDVGRTVVRDNETGYYYMVIASGTGKACLTALLASEYEIDIPLNTFREVDSSNDVGNAAANGGVLASDTTPILEADAAESLQINWATGNVDAISSTFTVPVRFDASRASYIDLYVLSGTTDAATFTVETSDNGSAKVSDSASDASTKSATLHKITATIAAGDIAADSTVTLCLTPTNAHATNAYILKGVKFRGYVA